MDVDLKKDLKEVEKTRKSSEVLDLKKLEKLATDSQKKRRISPDKIFKDISKGIDVANKMLLKVADPIETALSEYIPPLANPKIREGVTNVLEYSKDHNLVHWLANTNKRERREDIRALPGQIVKFVDRGIDRLDDIIRMSKRQRLGQDRKALSYDGFQTSYLSQGGNYFHNVPIEVVD